MATLSFTESFGAYGAKLANPMWANSALADDGALVISCWSHKLKLHEKVLTYTDHLSRWQHNTPGKNLLIEHLTKAHQEKLPARLVIATTDQPDVVERGEDASTIRKTFHIREDVVGSVTVFDGDEFILEFRRR